jgi:protein phosphatase-4 regulatory subunit 3
MLEYDPEFPRLKASYRDYLLNTTKFRQVVTIHDASILGKIHQTFRLQYLKDVVLARILDDSTFAVLNSLIFYHQADIVAFCTSSEVFLASLFQIFDKNKVETEEKKAEAIIFLQQLCAMGKQVQLPYRIALYRTLTEWGLLIVLEYALTRSEARLRNAAAEVLMTITEYDAMGVRVHVLEQVDKAATPLITKLSDILHEGDGELGLKTQITESLRILFDSGPDGSSGGPNVAQTLAAAAAAAAAANDGGRSQKDDTDRFLNWFYDGEVDHLFSPLKNLTTYKELNQQVANSKRATVIDITSPAKSALFNHLCELLTFIMVHHHFRSQYWVISSDISMRVATLLFAREKHLRLTALRFFRACLAKGNQFVNRHFLKIELIGAVLAVVEGEAERDNLVMSACLEFFEHIRKENIRALLSHLMERHEARVKALIESPKIGHYFKALELQWEKNNEPPPPSIFLEGESSVMSIHQAEKDRRNRDIARRGDNRAVMDLDEETYFNEDDGEGPQSKEEPLAAVKLVYRRTDGGNGKADVNEEKALSANEIQQADPVDLSETSLELPQKRKKRELEDGDTDDDDDMMGRLAKRKSISHGDGNDDDSAGGFIKEDDDKEQNKSSAAKKLTINLTPDSEKMVKKDAE